MEGFHPTKEDNYNDPSGELVSKPGGAAVPKQLGDHDKLPDTDVVEVVLQMSKEGKLNKRNPNQARA